MGAICNPDREGLPIESRFGNPEEVLKLSNDGGFVRKPKLPDLRQVCSKCPPETERSNSYPPVNQSNLSSFDGLHLYLDL
jgi:hypothetical protein